MKRLELTAINSGYYLWFDKSNYFWKELCPSIVGEFLIAVF